MPRSPTVFALSLIVAGCAPASIHPERVAFLASALEVVDAGAAECGVAPPVIADVGTCLPGVGIDYPVGPGQKYVTIGAVPMERLGPGDTLRIYPGTYHEKIMIGVLGATAALPFKLCGVPGPSGELPVIDGANATTRRELAEADYYSYPGHQVRGLIEVGHPHRAPYEATPGHILIEGLEIRGAAQPNTFTDASGIVRPYTSPVAGIFIERVDGLVVRGCSITLNNNGIYGGTGGGVEATRNVTLVGNHIWNNGSKGYEHNTYIEGINTVYEWNEYGAVRGGGAGIKDRGSATIRYNWIEGGAHLIGLVDAQEAKSTTVTMPEFHTTRVYGNVLVRGAASGALIRYGGDSGKLEDYRHGPLRFYNNTVIIKNAAYVDWSMSTAIVELSAVKLSTGEIATNELWSRNNVYWSEVPATSLRPIGLLGSRDQVISGRASFAGDWLANGWSKTGLTPGKATVDSATATGIEALTRGTDPGFASVAAGDYTIALSTQPLPASLAPVPAPLLQYVQHQATKTRAGAGIGALVR